MRKELNSPKFYQAKISNDNPFKRKKRLVLYISLYNLRAVDCLRRFANETSP